MSELRTAFDAVDELLASQTLPELPGALVEEDVRELMRGAQLIELWQCRYVAELERRGVHERDGHLSIASWLSTTFRLAWDRARGLVRIGRAFEDMPETCAAARAGEISMSQARVLVSAREVDTDAFAAAEGSLVAAARLHSVEALRRVVAYWRQAVEQDRGLDQDQRLRDRRHLHASPLLDGMVRVDGELDPETGACLLTALQAVRDAESRAAEEDDRTAPQARADALGEICRRWLDLAPRPEVAGERPHVSVIIDLEHLTGKPGSSEVDRLGPVSGDLAKRLACDASLTRVVLGPKSEPLDIGRRTAVVPPPMRRAVVARDGSCRFPGCERPAPWCDAHHVVHWADGGATSVANLLLLCRPHHRSVHGRGGFGLRLSDGRPVFTRPDGSVLEYRAPP
jgi:hypothetical protein